MTTPFIDAKLWLEQIPGVTIRFADAWSGDVVIAWHGETIATQHATRINHWAAWRILVDRVLCRAKSMAEARGVRGIELPKSSDLPNHPPGPMSDLTWHHPRTDGWRHVSRFWVNAGAAKLSVNDGPDANGTPRTSYEVACDPDAIVKVLCDAWLQAGEFLDEEGPESLFA